METQIQDVASGSLETLLVAAEDNAWAVTINFGNAGKADLVEVRVDTAPNRPNGLVHTTDGSTLDQACQKMLQKAGV